MNYPNEHPYTRVTEFKYLTGQRHPMTSVVYEYPQAEGDPYYPVPKPENAALYKKYKALADALPNVHFVGRLATYRYYNMDQVTAQALATFDKISEGVATAPTLAPAQGVDAPGRTLVGERLRKKYRVPSKKLKVGVLRGEKFKGFDLIRIPILQLVNLGRVVRFLLTAFPQYIETNSF